MSVSRYARTPVLALGKRFGTSSAIKAIRAGIASGTIQFRETTLSGLERLDTIAGNEYGDGRYWWVIAAASNIGWASQVPPGTYLRIPLLDDVLLVMG